jgi:hypothetical protein
MSTQWTDILGPFRQRERAMEELLSRRMAIERGQQSIYSLPQAKELTESVYSASNLGFGQLLDAMNKSGLPGSYIETLARQVPERAGMAAGTAVNQMYQQYNPTQLALERARLGLGLAQLRNEFYKNQMMQDAMNAQNSGLGGIGSLIGGIAGIAGTVLGGPAGGLAGGLGGLVGGLGKVLGLGSQMGTTAYASVPYSDTMGYGLSYIK